MGKAGKIAVVAALAAALAAVVAVRRGALSSTTAPPAPPGAGPPLPRLVDLGSTTCIPCKMMAPILEELKTEYAGRLQVEFIDVWKEPEAGRKYNVSIIPTQVFFDASGKELWRHEGFISKQDILAKWKQFGIDLAAAPAPPGVQ